MKKIVLSVVALAMACAAPAAAQEPVAASPESMREELEADAKEPIAFTANGTWNVLPAITGLIRQYEASRQLPQVNFTAIDSGQIVERLCRRQCDVGMPFDSFVPASSRKAAHEFRRATLGRFVVAVAVNADSPLRSLTVEQVRRIFAWDLLTGGTTSWKEVEGSGGSAPIEMRRPPTFSPASLVFRKNLGILGPFTDEFSDPANRPPCEKPTDTAVVEEIAKHPNAIGLFVCRCEQPADKRIRVLGIAKDNGSRSVAPSPSTIADGSYPLTDLLTLYLRLDAPAAASDFSRLAAGPEGAKIVKQSGLWPEYELKKLLGDQRLAEVKSGKGAAVGVVGPARSETLVKELALKYVEEQEAVQAHYRKRASQAEAAGEILDGKAELMLLDGTLKTALPADIAAGLEKNCKRVVLGQTALGIVVHPNTLVKSLSIDELRQIFGGQIKNWEGGKGAGSAIHGYGLPADQPVMQIYKRMLVGKGLGKGSGVGEATGDGKTGGQSLAGAAGSRAGTSGGQPLASAVGSLKLTAEADTAKVVLAVARDPDGIGLVDLSQMPKDDKSVTLLAIDLQKGTRARGQGSGDAEGKPLLALRAPIRASVQPIAGDVPDDYPLVRPCVIYVSPNAGAAAKDFAGWLASATSAPDRAELLARFELLPPKNDSASGDIAAKPDAVAPPGELVATLGKEPQIDLEEPRAGGTDSVDAHSDLVNPAERRNVTAKSAKDAKKKVAASAVAQSDKRDSKEAVEPVSPGADDSADPFGGVRILWGLAAIGGIVSVVAVRRVTRRKSLSAQRVLRRQLRDTGFANVYGSLDDPTGSTGGASGISAADGEPAAAVRVGKTFDPYHVWLSIPREEQPPNHYRLLGLAAFESDKEVIDQAADRQMAYLRTYQLGQFAALSEELLNEVSAAKGCLLSPTKKPLYDAHLRRRLAKATT